MQSNDKIGRRTGVESDDQPTYALIQGQYEAAIDQGEAGCLKIVRHDAWNNRTGDYFIHGNRSAMMALYSYRVIDVAIAIHHVVVRCGFTSMTAGAMKMIETGAAVASGFTVLLIACPRHLRAAITMTHRFKVPETTTPDNRPAVENDNR